MKTRVVASVDDVEELLECVRAAAIAAMQSIRDASEEGAMAALWRMKFEPLGCDPIDGKSRLNLIEQLNQSYTYVATGLAIRQLFGLHPECAPYRLNLGTASGSDIESADPGDVAAEVFAAVTPSNNQKLKKDIAKVGASAATHRYVFFMSPGFEPGRQEQLETGASVQVWALGGKDVL